MRLRNYCRLQYVIVAVCRCTETGFQVSATVMGGITAELSLKEVIVAQILIVALTVT